MGEPEVPVVPALPIRTPLYEAITCVLSCALESDNEVQKLANERKKKLEHVEEYPLVLCEVIGSEEEALAERQLAATFLKNYLEELFLRHRENPAFFHTGMGSRIALKLLGYLDNSVNLKQMISYNLALLLALGHWDTLTLQLNDMIKSEDSRAIYNAVFVLSQAIDSNFFESRSDITVDHHWFNVFREVFKMKDIEAVTRMYTIHPMFVMMKYVKPTLDYVVECWTKLAEDFGEALNESYSPSSDFQFKSEILKCLQGGTNEFPEYCHIFVPPSLPAIGNLITVCCQQYKKVIKGAERIPKDATESSDSDPANFYELVNYLLEFINCLVDMTYFDVLIDDLENLLYCIFIFMGCHDDMERYLFVNVLDKDHHWRIRELCCQIISFVLQKIEVRPNGRVLFFKSMHSVFLRFTNEISTLENDTTKIVYMTRLTESMIFGLGLVREKYIANDPATFPFNYYINHWTAMMAHSNLWLQGRILWLGAIYCTELTPHLLSIHVKTILQNLNASSGYALPPSAEALCNYLKFFKTLTNDKQYIISSEAKNIMICLLSVARRSKSFPLHHALNALGYFIKSHQDVAAAHLNEIEDILIKTVVNHFADTYMMKEVSFVVAKLAQNQSFKTLIHDKFLTFLMHVVLTLEPKAMKNDPDKALDLLNTFTLFCDRIDDYFIAQAFTGAASLLKDNIERDVEVDDSAGNLLITLISKVSTRLQFIRTLPKGSIIEEFPHVLKKLIETEKTGSGDMLGKLVITTIFSIPQLMEPHFENILQNIITSCCKKTNKLRGNWIIFAFICMLRTTDTLNYLSSLPGPNGGSALNFIMKLWLIDYIPDLDIVERKVVVLSLTQILQNCLKNENDYSIMKEICVAFDQKPNEESPTGEIFNGVEYFYYLLIQLLLFDQKVQKDLPVSTEPYHFEDFGEDAAKYTEERDIILFHNHPFNINITEHLVAFFKTGNEPYFNIIRKFVSTSNYFKLRSLGCCVPDLNIHEDME